MSYFIEKSLRNDGTKFVVLVDENFKIVEPVALFLEYLNKKGYALNTIESYCSGLKEYFIWLKKENLRFHEVTKRDMFSWIEYIETEAGDKQIKSARTINKYLAIVGSFYSYFESYGGYIDNPIIINNQTLKHDFKTFQIKKEQVSVNFFRRKEEKKKNTRRLFRNQIEVLYQTIGNLKKDEALNFRNRLVFKILYETGFRISELLALRIIDYSEPNPIDDIGVIHIRRHYPLYHKDHSLKTNERDIPVSMQLIYEIDNYVCNFRPQNSMYETIFVSHSNASKGKYMTRNSIEEIFIELSNLTGIKCTPHMLRHTHGTELKESGYSEIYIMDRLGHNSMESTNQYMHLSYEAQTEAYYRFLEKRR